MRLYSKYLFIYISAGHARPRCGGLDFFTALRPRRTFAQTAGLLRCTAAKSRGCAPRLVLQCCCFHRWVFAAYRYLHHP